MKKLKTRDWNRRREEVTPIVAKNTQFFFLKKKQRIGREIKNNMVKVSCFTFKVWRLRSS